MGIHLSTKMRKRNADYLFVDDVSKDCYENALFMITFKYYTLKPEQVEFIDEYLQNQLNNLIEMINGYDDSSVHSGSHEDRIKQLENEIATLTNNVNSQATIYGVLRITPNTVNMDFNKEGTMIKFTNKDNGVYTTSILQKETPLEIILPIGEYTVNVVNSLNDVKDSVFTELWENATSEDNNHTAKYTVVEGNTDLTINIEYE